MNELSIYFEVLSLRHLLGVRAFVGPFVERFEQMVALTADTSTAVAASSGTTGLHLALVTAGVKPNDLVIIPAFTFSATANAVSHAGASPWLVDFTKDHWCMDGSVLERLLVDEAEGRRDGIFHCQSGGQIGAIMPVFTLGLIPT